MNALALNPLDGHLYAFQSGTHNLLRVSTEGAAEVVLQGSMPGSNVGDIDINGRYWISNAGQNWWVIDLYPGSATYGKILNSGTADTLDVSVADWVYLPNEGQYLWSAGRNSTSGGSSLIRFSLSTFEWERVANYPTLPNALGGQWGMNNGTLYGADTNAGIIWQYPISGTPFKMSDGPVSSDTDGARCVLNLTG
ncbi:hypothetical protein F5884DRAFT_490974 [Xylogone sp. PMI_703]|nr:hypothetical protein F5884DRAFT_490974 [Xylogone sp. PMI_703]